MIDTLFIKERLPLPWEEKWADFVHEIEDKESIELRKKIDEFEQQLKRTTSTEVNLAVKGTSHAYATLSFDT